jgi:hypothetical protein
VADDADRERRERRVVRGVVERERAAVREGEQHRRILVVRAQHAETQASERREGVGDVAKEALHVLRHEVRLLAAREPMQCEEAIQRRAALGITRPAEARLSRVLEASDLPAQLVPLLLPESLHVRFEVAGEGEARARDEA